MSKAHYTRTAIVLHWLIGFGILGMFLLGWFMVDLPQNAPKQAAYDLFNWGLYTWQLQEPISPLGFYINLHKSIGVTILALVIVRIMWRLWHQPPPPLPNYSAWEIKLSNSVHHALYLLMVLLPLSGVLMAVNGLYGIQWFGIPFLSGTDNKVWREWFQNAHEIIGFILLIVLSLHVAGALKHHFYDKDKTLRRMLLDREI